MPECCVSSAWKKVRRLGHLAVSFCDERFSSKEWNRCMESAYEHYLQASSTRLAMRVLSEAVYFLFCVTLQGP